jgi:hypothetical protein
MHDGTGPLQIQSRLLRERVLLFTSRPEDWMSLLTQAKHWKRGFSARTLAHSWEAAGGFPVEVDLALARSSQPHFFNSPFQVRSATVQHRRHGGVNGRGKGQGQGL